MKLPRVMIAAPKSGSGKTLITCGLLEVLKRKGTDVRSYKCGPDYIDPMFHRMVIGVPGGNLDSFFSSDEQIRNSLAAAGSEAAVIEGVMGIYDGVTGLGEKGSCYEIASVTDTPVMLIVDVKGMGQTMLSLIKGILADDTGCLVRGLVLNRISAHYYETIAPLIRDCLKEISAGRRSEVLLLGGIPDSRDIHLESRHLGLMMPGEISDLKEQVSKAADLIEDHLDLNGVLSLMDSAAELSGNGNADAPAYSDGPVLAVARDEVFCFYYEENLQMLKDAGIMITEFSPLRDSRVPEEADGLLLGGGYPELYAESLSGNKEMLASVRSCIDSGMPSLAECGGFMYLLDKLEDAEGSTYDMAGVIRGKSYNTKKLTRFGYITVREKNHLSCAGTLISGLTIRGHEFHYYDSDNNGSNVLAVRPGSEMTWECIHAGEDHLWGFPHLYYPSCPELIRRFRDALLRYNKRKGAQHG